MLLRNCGLRICLRITANPGQSALLVGATGATGRHVLRELLKDPQFTRVGEFGRRLLPESELHGVDTSKLERKTVDFEKVDEKEWKEGRWDVIYITFVHQISYT
jgi:oxidoreductase